MPSFTFHLQDPSAPETTYLFEAIVGQLAALETVRWRAMFAFATGGGVISLFKDAAHQDFQGRGGETDLVVGLDSITDEPALTALQLEERDHPKFSSRVFHNDAGGLFHPKVCHFTQKGGDQTVIVGSGNLTPGGLRGNVEAFCVVRFDVGEQVDLRPWDAFLLSHADAIRSIDEDALARARENARLRQSRPRKKREAEPDVAPSAEEPAGDSEPPAPVTSRVLVAYVPKAGDRWKQVHLNRDVVDQFFRVMPESAQRVFLTEVLPGGALQEEEARHLVYSPANKNMKIEFAARRADAYPDEHPILVVLETGLRTFKYLMLLPEDDGYSEMRLLLGHEASLGRGLQRVLTTRQTAMAFWQRLPL